MSPHLTRFKKLERKLGQILIRCFRQIFQVCFIHFQNTRFSLSNVFGNILRDRVTVFRKELDVHITFPEKG